MFSKRYNIVESELKHLDTKELAIKNDEQLRARYEKFYCGKTFSRKSSLMYHIKNKHSFWNRVQWICDCKLQLYIAAIMAYFYIEYIFRPKLPDNDAAFNSFNRSLPMVLRIYNSRVEERLHIDNTNAEQVKATRRCFRMPSRLVDICKEYCDEFISRSYKQVA